MQAKTFFVLFVACFFYYYPSSSMAAYYEDDDSNYYVTQEYVGDEMNDDSAYYETERDFYESPKEIYGYRPYPSRVPKQVSAHEKMIVVNPREHVWSAYASNGKLLRSGLATAGAKWCGDIGRPCRTKTGVFRIQSLGNSDCVSKIYPVGEGGAPMPYCMFFNGGQGLHGSNQLAEANISHGCVRISINDAEWLRYHFAEIGTLVVVQSY